MELVYQTSYDAALYPEVFAGNDALAALVASKAAQMKAFMDKMKGGVKTMRSFVTYGGVTYTLILKL